MDLRSPPADGALLVAGMKGYLDAVAGDTGVGVLDVDRDDLPGVDGTHTQTLAGDHDGAVPKNFALDADRPGRWRGQRGVGNHRAAQPGAPGGGDRRRQRFSEDAVGDDMEEAFVEPERNPGPARIRANLDLMADLDHGAGEQSARAPRIRSSARSSGVKLDGTVLVSRLPHRPRRGRPARPWPGPS